MSHTQNSPPPCTRCIQLEAEVKRLRAMIEDLQRGQKRQAAPFSKGLPKSDPHPPGRKPGEDYGVKAHRLPPEEVDEVHDVPLPERCPRCGGADIEPMGLEPQFQVEIPRKPIRRRFNIHLGRCRGCGRSVRSRHPLQTTQALGSAGSGLGAEAQATAVILNKELGLSHGKVAHVFDKVFGIALSRGGSAQVVERSGRRLEPAYREIVKTVKRSRKTSWDETGWKVGGLLWWMHVGVAARATLYRIDPGRGHEVAEDVLGAAYTGIMSHDGWKPYDFFENARHQQCISHLVRRCGNLLLSATRGAVRLPRAVKHLLQEALALRDRRDEKTISLHGVRVATGRLSAGLDRLTTGRCLHPGNRRLARFLLRHRDSIFTFLKHPGIEATNWKAEQAIRPAVVNRKVWGGNRTAWGAHIQECVISVIRTCYQQRVEPLMFLSKTLRSPPDQAPQLLLS